MVLDYLAGLQEAGRAYRTVNTHRSAISAYHIPIQNIPVGQHPRVCALLKGVSKECPPEPKLVSVWDVSVMIRYFISLGANDSMSLKDLSLKLVALLALTSFHRGSKLHALNSHFMSVFSDRIEFLFNKNFKHSKQGKTEPPSIFFKFSPNRLLCPKACIQDYLKSTGQWRNPSDGSLFISFVNPHKPVTKQSLTRWLKQSLVSAGINSHYTSHSTRSAASSKARAGGISIPDILAKGNWTNRTTFEKFYNKNIDAPSRNLQISVLQSTSN
jgi:hypothetical protein